MKNIAIIGAGAVGSIILYLIKDGRFNIDIFATKKRAVIIEKDGHLIHTDYTTKTLKERKRQYDIVFVTTKAFTMKSLVPTIESMIHKDTIVIICQNGFSQHTLLTHPYVYHAVVYISGQKANDKVIYFRDDTLVLPVNHKTKYIKEVFQNTRLTIERADDYYSQIWFKLLVNLGINSLTALTKNTAQIQKLPEIKKLMIQLLNEGIIVANKEAQNFNENTIDQILNIYSGYPDHMGTSMYYDTLNQTLTEYEFIQGYIYNRARKHQLSTPTLDIVYALLKGYQFNRNK